MYYHPSISAHSSSFQPKTRLIHWLAPLSYKVNKFCHSSWFGSVFCIWCRPQPFTRLLCTNQSKSQRGLAAASPKIRLSVCRDPTNVLLPLNCRQSIPLLLISVIWWALSFSQSSNRHSLYRNFRNPLSSQASLVSGDIRRDFKWISSLIGH